MCQGAEHSHFFFGTLVHGAVLKYSFYVSVHLPHQCWIIFTASSTQNEEDRLSLESLFFWYTRKCPPSTQFHKYSPHSFTCVHKLHAHTVRPMRGTGAHPLHFMVNSAGCDGSVCWCLQILHVQFCIFLSLLQVLVCVRLLGVFTYIAQSQCAYVHTAASVAQLGSVWSKGGLQSFDILS